MGFFKKALGKSLGGKILGKAVKHDPLGKKLLGKDPVGKTLIGGNKKSSGTTVKSALMSKMGPRTGGNAQATPMGKRMQGLAGEGQKRGLARRGRFNP